MQEFGFVYIGVAKRPSKKVFVLAGVCFVLYKGKELAILFVSFQS